MPSKFGPSTAVRIVNWADQLGGWAEYLAANPGGIPVVSNGGTYTITPTVTAGIYAAGDNVGGLLTFANSSRAVGGGGVIKDVIIIDDAGQDAGEDVGLISDYIGTPVPQETNPTMGVYEYAA